MSLLPQRKKSPEEIAELRESIGVPGTLSPQPSIPATSADTSLPTPEAPTITPPPAEPKPVRSLRKSEQRPHRSLSAPANRHSNLPEHRHGPKEIEELRRREALARMGPPPANPKLAMAHNLTVAVGYVSALAGSSFFFTKEFPLVAAASCEMVALLTALHIFLRTPLSKHHAGFIAAITLCVTAFGTLHYFPQIQYAT